MDAIVSLGLDGAAFESGLRRAMASAEGFSGRLGGLARGGGSGIALIGVAALGVAKYMLRAKEEADKLHLSVTKLTSNIGGGLFRSTGEIDTSISSLTKKLEELREAQNPSSFGGILKKELASEPDFRIPFTKGSSEDIKNQRDIERVQSAIGRELDAQVIKQRDLADIQLETFSGSEEEAEKMKEIRRYKEEIGAIDERYSGVEGGGEARNKLQQEAARRNLINLQSISRSAALKREEVESESRLLGYRERGASVEEKNIARVKERIRLIDSELKRPTTSLRREQLAVNRSTARMDLRDAQFDAADMSPDAVQARNAASLHQLRRNAFNTGIDQMENTNRAAYGAVVSGIGKVGPQESGYRRPQFQNNLNPSPTPSGGNIDAKLDALRDAVNRPDWVK